MLARIALRKNAGVEKTYSFAYRPSFFAFLLTRAAPAKGALKTRQQYPAVTAAPSRSDLVALAL